MLFEKGVSARKFASTSVDVFAKDLGDGVLNQYQTGSRKERLVVP